MFGGLIGELETGGDNRRLVRQYDRADKYRDCVFDSRFHEELARVKASECIEYCFQSYLFLTNREMDQSTQLPATASSVVGQAHRLLHLLNGKWRACPTK